MYRINTLNKLIKNKKLLLFIDREAREIMHLVVSVRLFALSHLNRLTYDLHIVRMPYQFKVFVCVSVISGRMRIIVRMRSIGVLIIAHVSPVIS